MNAGMRGERKTGGVRERGEREKKKSNPKNVKYALKIEQDYIFECSHLSYEKYFNFLLRYKFLCISWLVQTLLAGLYAGGAAKTSIRGSTGRQC